LDRMAGRHRDDWSVIAALIVAGCATDATVLVPPVETREVLSQVYEIDRIYKSMQGPSSTIGLVLDSISSPELVWVTGYRAEVVGPDGVTPLPAELMCHSNLGFDAERHAKQFGWTKRPPRRLFTVSQGQERIDLPQGTGIPLFSDEPLTLTTQVLNHNLPDADVQVRVKVSIDFVRDRNVRRPLRPLYLKSANALVRLGEHDGHFGAPLVEESEEEGAHDGMAASARVIQDHQGRRFSGHWVVPPGRQEQTTSVTHWMNLTSDATVHYIAVHLHAFAERLSLRDATTGEPIFSSLATGYPDRIGLQRVTALSSPEGIVIQSGHEYELTSTYDNTSGRDQEAMAVMYLYLLDEEFRNPAGR